MFGTYDTVDGITATFVRTVERLTALADKRRATATYNEQLAKEYASTADSHNKEAARAVKIASRISKLLEDE